MYVSPNGHKSTESETKNDFPLKYYWDFHQALKLRILAEKHPHHICLLPMLLLIDGKCAFPKNLQDVEKSSEEKSRNG